MTWFVGILQSWLQKENNELARIKVRHFPFRVIGHFIVKLSNWSLLHEPEGGSKLQCQFVLSGTSIKILRGKAYRWAYHEAYCTVSAMLSSFVHCFLLLVSNAEMLSTNKSAVRGWGFSQSHRHAISGPEGTEQVKQIRRRLLHSCGYWNLSGLVWNVVRAGACGDFLCKLHTSCG